MYIELSHYLLIMLTVFIGSSFAAWILWCRPYGVGAVSKPMAKSHLLDFPPRMPYGLSRDFAPRGSNLISRFRGQSKFFLRPWAWTCQYKHLRWMMSLYFVILTMCLFAALACYMCSDLSIYGIFTNSNVNMPLFYKISATWSNHEGSLLLWCWLLSLYGFVFCGSVFQLPEGLWKAGGEPLETDHFMSFVSRQTQSSSLKHYQSLLSLGQVSVLDMVITKMFYSGTQFDVNWIWIPLWVNQSIFSMPLRERARPLAIYICILLFFVCFLLITSNPFLPMTFMCLNSVAELNPVLQDPVLAIHPPCIYAGYVASAVGFSICLSTLAQAPREAGRPSGLPTFPQCITKWKTLIFVSGQKMKMPFTAGSGKSRTEEEQNQDFCSSSVLDFVPKRPGKISIFAPSSARSLPLVALQLHTRSPSSPLLTVKYTPQIRIWILICWCCLTVGILLGSWWAYHELGWGGWWFWDPVENASLMPWLLATACIHSVLVPRLNSWTLGLNISTFVLSILGTFFVRSGLLASVHSFATDSSRGVFLLCFWLCVTTVSVIGLFRIYDHQKPLICRTQIEQILLLQNFFLCIICLIVLCGTSAPLVFQWCFNRDVSTGAPFFNGTIVPLFSGLLVVLIYVHYIKWSSISLVHTFFNRAKPPKSTFSLSGSPRPQYTLRGSYSYRKRGHGMQQFSFLNTAGLYSVCLLLICNFLILTFVVGFSYLEAVYGLLCMCVFCSLLFSTPRLINSLDFAPKALPSRLIAFSTHLQKAALYMKTSHAGIVLFIIGILCSNAHKIQFTQVMHPGSEVRLDTQVCSVRSIDHNYGPTFHSICGNLVVYRHHEPLSALWVDKISRETAREENVDFPKIDIFRKSTFLSPPPLNLDCGRALPPFGGQKMSILFSGGQGGTKNLNFGGKSNLFDSFQPGLKDSFLCIQDAFCIFPEKRFFISNQELSTTKVAIHTNLFSDIYALIGTGSAETGSYTTIMKLPFIGCIWVGFILAAIGGLWSLSSLLCDRKLNWY